MTSTKYKDLLSTLGAQIDAELAAATTPPTPPAPTLSPDGSVLLASAVSGGSLRTSHGLWTFGAVTGKDRIILLNGQQASGGYAVSLRVANSGQVYALNSNGGWFLWKENGWWIAGDPTAPPKPSPPPPPPPPVSPPPANIPPSPPPVPQPPAASGSLAAIATFSDGTARTFAKDAAVALDSFTDAATGETFTRSEINAYPWRITFQSDGKRDKIIFLYGGDMRDQAPKHFGAYTVAIQRAGLTVQTISVPVHYWGARWCWDSEKRPVVFTPAQLVASKLVPPFLDIPTNKSPAPAPPYSIMGTSNQARYMGQTGERYDIGLLPEYDARYIATGKDWASVDAWADAAGSWPCKLYDNGLPIDWRKYPNAYTYGSNSNPPVMIAPAVNPDANGYAQDMIMDMAHWPALSHLRYVSARDPYDLEELQAAANWMLAWSPMNGHVIGGDWQQVRGDAWLLCRLLYCWLDSPPDASCPKWLLPKSYWKAVLDKNLAFFKATYMPPSATNVRNTRFNSATSILAWPMFMEDYLCAVLGLMVWCGLAEWRPVFEWKLRSNIARSSGLSGWPSDIPVQYWLRWAKAADGSYVDHWDGSAPVTLPANWGELWDWNKDFNFNPEAVAARDSAGKAMAGGQDQWYLSYDRMCFVLAQKIGVDLPDLNTAIANAVPKITPIEYRHAV